VIDDGVRENMRKVLSEIREGTFAQEWIKEMDTGEAHLDELRAKAAEERVEDVGERLRGLMHREEQGVA
jgi:ketol-acid reductoisomerase